MKERENKFDAQIKDIEKKRYLERRKEVEEYNMTHREKKREIRHYVTQRGRQHT